MRCKLDHHPNRDEIDRQIVSGVPLRSICASFNIALTTIHRHKDCIKEVLSQAMQHEQGEREERGSLLVDRVTKLAGEAEELVAIAKAEKNYRGATSALVAACKLLDLVGRLSGELQQANAAGGGLHLTMNRVTNNTIVAVDNDADFAAMIGEATKGFDHGELDRLKALVHNTRETPLLMR
jgi:hypothetical protein